jgi:hypothetical protein
MTSQLSSSGSTSERLHWCSMASSQVARMKATSSCMPPLLREQARLQGGFRIRSIDWHRGYSGHD